MTDNRRSMRFRRAWVALSVLALAAVNLIIAAPLFGVEYSAYNGSIEGTFIAIARVMAHTRAIGSGGRCGTRGCLLKIRICRCCIGWSRPSAC